MRVHEYQAKELLSSHGVAIPAGRPASTKGEARAIAAELGTRCLVKAQVHAGARGKGGGIKVVSLPEDAEEAAGAMLGSALVTSQTGPSGLPVRHVLVEEAVAAESELYLAITVDANSRAVVALASTGGGVDVEDTETTIERVAIDPLLGFQPYHGRRLAQLLGLPRGLVSPFVWLVGNVYRVFVTYDCTLLEINPLGVTREGALVALDAKITFDDDALFKHPELESLYDPDQEDTGEARAREFGASYIRLAGDVGCIVNGAGLALATMDMMHAAGAVPANFLDVGGAADDHTVAQALHIVLGDPGVRCVLVNIFGGILRCDDVARGILMGAEALSHFRLRPLIVRMLGTNADEGRQILAKSSLDVTLVDDLDELALALQRAL